MDQTPQSKANSALPAVAFPDQRPGLPTPSVQPTQTNLPQLSTDDRACSNFAPETNRWPQTAIPRVAQPNSEDMNSAQCSRNDFDLEIVVPLYNEQEVVVELHERLRSVCRSLRLRTRLIYVADGCRDQTLPRLLGCLDAQDQVEIIELSRNFGQPAAILAGLRAASARAVVVMDGDLQDPPELIPTLWSHWQAGQQIVIAQRQRRAEQSRWRKWCFQGFHWLFQRLTDLQIPAHCGTFCLLDRRAVQAICSLPESHRFFPGLRAWIGFKQTLVDYERPARAAGSPKQTLRRLIRYAGDGIFGYSRRPIGLLAMVASLLIALGGLGFVLGGWAYVGGQAPWLVAIGLVISCLSVFSGTQLLGLALIGAWVARVYEQAKQRPAYFIAQQQSLGSDVVSQSSSAPTLWKKAG